MCGCVSAFMVAWAMMPASSLLDLRTVLREWQAARLPQDQLRWFAADDALLLAGGELESLAEIAYPDEDGRGGRTLYVSEDAHTGATIFQDAIGMPLAVLPPEEGISPRRRRIQQFWI